MMSFGSGRWAVAVLAVSVCLGFAAPALAQRAWSVPLDLTPGGQQARRPRLAMDDNGHALATQMTSALPAASSPTRGWTAVSTGALRLTGVPHAAATPS